MAPLTAEDLYLILAAIVQKDFYLGVMA